MKHMPWRPCDSLKTTFRSHFFSSSTTGSKDKAQVTQFGIRKLLLLSESSCQPHCPLKNVFRKLEMSQGRKLYFQSEISYRQINTPKGVLTALFFCFTHTFFLFLFVFLNKWQLLYYYGVCEIESRFVQMLQCMCWGQRTAFESEFRLSTTLHTLASWPVSFWMIHLFLPPISSQEGRDYRCIPPHVNSGYQENSKNYHSSTHLRIIHPPMNPPIHPSLYHSPIHSSFLSSIKEDDYLIFVN